MCIITCSEMTLKPGHIATAWEALMCSPRMVNVSFSLHSQNKTALYCRLVPTYTLGILKYFTFPGSYMQQNKTSGSSLHSCCLLYLAPTLKWLWAFIKRELSQHWAHVKDGVGFPLWRLKTEGVLYSAKPNFMAMVSQGACFLPQHWLRNALCKSALWVNGITFPDNLSFRVNSMVWGCDWYLKMSPESRSEQDSPPQEKEVSIAKWIWIAIAQNLLLH